MYSTWPHSKNSTQARGRTTWTRECQCDQLLNDRLGEKGRPELCKRVRFARAIFRNGEGMITRAVTARQLLFKILHILRFLPPPTNNCDCCSGLTMMWDRWQNVHGVFNIADDDHQRVNELVVNANIRVDRICSWPSSTESQVMVYIYNRLLFKHMLAWSRNRSTNCQLGVWVMSGGTLYRVQTWAKTKTWSCNFSQLLDLASIEVVPFHFALYNGRAHKSSSSWSSTAKRTLHALIRYEPSWRRDIWPAALMAKILKEIAGISGLGALGAKKSCGWLWSRGQDERKW